MRAAMLDMIGIAGSAAAKRQLQTCLLSTQNRHCLNRPNLLREH
jgi:hypothetical protein